MQSTPQKRQKAQATEMATLQYSIVSLGDEANITVFANGGVYVAHSSHPNYDTIAAEVLGEPYPDADYVISLFDTSQAVADRFENLSERVTVANGRVYFDGDEVNNALTKQIVRFLQEDLGDWQPLVLFMENVAQNPNEHSREQLYRWLSQHEFPINENGHIVAYKGVTQPDEDGIAWSIHSGRATVNGEVYTGRIPNEIGSVVEMPRLDVHHDPGVGCSTGLHAGTWNYASGFGQGTTLTVAINPRDVVSVPTDCEDQKVRVCRYYVEDVVTDPYYSAYTGSDEYDDEYDDGYDDDEAEYEGYDEDYERLTEQKASLAELLAEGRGLPVR
jgi:hypothetical protein